MEILSEKLEFNRTVCENTTTRYPTGIDAKSFTTRYIPTKVKAGLHYQSFCDHSWNFAKVNSAF